MGLVIVLLGFPLIILGICASEIAESYFENKTKVEKLHIRADLLKAGIDPDRLDKEGKEE